MHRKTTQVLAACAAAVTAPIALAGDVNPPAGPIASTFQTLEEMEPRIPLSAENTPGDANSVFEITAPGHYYLTADVNAPAGFNAIEIEARRVTIDLNGFRLVGNGVGRDGIAINQQKDNYVVKNGFISGFTNDGVNAGDDSDIYIENVVSSNNDNRGFGVGRRSRLVNCAAIGNGGNGFFVGGESTLEDCDAEANGGNGFSSESMNVTMTRCRAISNTSAGLAGASGYVIRESAFNNNGEAGISLAGTAVIENTTVSFNGQSGLTSFGDTIVRNSNASNNGQTSPSGGGFFLGGDGNVIVDSAASDNANDGFTLVNESIARGCVAYENGGDGFDGGHGVSLFDCRSENNSQDGANISVRGTVEGGAFNFNGSVGVRIPTGVVRGVYAAKNGGAGIRLESAPTNDIRSGVRCEDNTVAQNGNNGIQVVSVGHFIIRNFLKGNAGDEIFGSASGNWIGLVTNGPGTMNTSNSFVNWTLSN